MKLFKSYTIINKLPESIEIDQYVFVTEYKQLIQFVYKEHKDLGRGRSSSEPSLSKKANLAELLNCLGYFSMKYESACIDFNMYKPCSYSFEILFNQLRKLLYTSKFSVV